MKETWFQLYHHVRSLALRAQVLAQHCHYNGALAVMDDIQVLYKPELHSKAISEEYATDHTAARMFSFSVLWLHHLNQIEEAEARCNFAASNILPEMDPSNMLSLTLVLLPIIKFLISRGRADANRAYNLYNDYVVKNFDNRDTKRTASSLVFRPMVILLTCCGVAFDIEGNPVKYSGMQDDIVWMLNGEVRISDWADTMSTAHMNWSIYSIFSEACLELAKRVRGDKEKALIEEGLCLSRLAENHFNNESRSNKNPIAYSFHRQIYSNLQDWSTGQEYNYTR